MIRGTQQRINSFAAPMRQHRQLDEKAKGQAVSTSLWQQLCAVKTREKYHASVDKSHYSIPGMQQKLPECSKQAVAGILQSPECSCSCLHMHACNSTRTRSQHQLAGIDSQAPVFICCSTCSASWLHPKPSTLRMLD